MIDELNIRARLADMCIGRDQINLYAFMKPGHGCPATVAEPLVMSSVDEGFVMAPMITIDKAVSQQLIDDLWDCGLRPSEGSGSAGSLKATENHLNDMRTLIFHVLKVDKEGKKDE